MRQYDLENRMLTLLDRYEEQELSEYHIFRDYYIFTETDTATAERITEKVLNGIDYQICGTSVTEDGLAMVNVMVEAREYGYDADEADDRVKRMVDEILKDSKAVYDFDSDYIAA